LQAQSDLENQAERYEQIISLMKSQSLQCERVIADLAQSIRDKTCSDI